MKIELLTTLEGTEELGLEWNDLVEKSGNSVFSKYAFNKNVEDFYGDLAQPRICLAYEGNNLIGVAPLSEENGILRFTTGLEYKGIADYCDFIIDPEEREKVLREFQKILENHGKFDLREIPQYSETIRYFERGKIKNAKEPSSKLSLPPTWEEYYNQLRNSFKKSLRKIETDFPDITLETLTEKSELEKMMDEFMQLHQEEWNARELPGCFADDERHSRFRNYHRELARNLFKEGNLSLSKLVADDQTLSVIYCFVDKNKIYNYLGAVNLKFKKYSPGRIVNLYLIKNSINKKNIYDFLRGFEEYKNDFGVEWSNNQNISNI